MAGFDALGGIASKISEVEKRVDSLTKRLGDITAVTNKLNDLYKTLGLIADLADDVKVTELLSGLDAVKKAIPDVITGLGDIARLKGLIFNPDEVGEGIAIEPQTPAAEV